MSTQELPSNFAIYLRLLWVVLLVSVAALAGFWVGELSVPDDGPPPIIDRGNMARTAAAGLLTEHGDLPAVDVPAWFFMRPTPEGDWSTALEEVKLAAANGIHRYVVARPLPWSGADGVERTVQVLDQIVALDPAARVLLELDLNPPPAWLRTHDEDVVQVNGQLLIYPSMGSRIWLHGVQSALSSLIEGLEQAEAGAHVEGFVLAALENGRWYRSGGYDRSPANREGFRAWLGRHYGDDSSLQAAWGDAETRFETVEVPEMPATDDPLQVFFTLPEERRLVDYLRYVSESTADNIAAITAHIKGALKSEPLVLANYGYSFELGENAAGHFALGKLLTSDLDGFVSPVSYIDRGLGGNGGVMGPVHSVLAHGKTWIVVDDTRTGITWNNTTNTVERIKGIQPEDVYNVQLRNFGSALVQGIGIGWMDPEGQGWLQDPAQWEFFGELAGIYQQCLIDGTLPPLLTAPSPTPLEEAAEVAVAGEEPAPVETAAVASAERVGLVVVVDEQSRYYQQAGGVINNRVLIQARDAAIRAGLSVQFVLMSDVLGDRTPPAGAYLFTNAFQLAEPDRDRLHARLAREGAAAIWLYAPGYFSDTADAENISKTVRMQVKEFQKKRVSGSRFLLSGAWVKQDEQIGTEQEWDPLFYISDEQVDVVAKYVASDEASIAVRFMEDWTSIYVAEPAITPGLLRELLELLEQHLYFRTTSQSQFDTMYLGHEMLVVHAGKAGDRVIDFGRYCDVLDLINTDYGWSQKYTFFLEMDAGETRLLRLYPLETQELLGAEPLPE